MMTYTKIGIGSTVFLQQLFVPSAISKLRCCWSVNKLSLTPWDPMDCSSPGSSVLHWLLEFAKIQVHWIGYAIQPSHPLLPPSPPALNLSPRQGLFHWVSSLHQVAKILKLQLSINPSNEDSGSFPLGFIGVDLLAVQGALKSLLQHHNSKVSILWHSAFFMIQL